MLLSTMHMTNSTVPSI